MAETDFDIVIVGGGIVGLAVGYYCSLMGISTAVLERHESFCEEASSHNSGVIHSGFNQTPGTLKARLNMAGARLMYAKSEEWSFRTRKVGTVVAASEESQMSKIREIRFQGEKNGVRGLKILNSRDIREVEPDAEGIIGALFSPDGGVVDIMEYISRLIARASKSGAILAAGRSLVNVKSTRDQVSLNIGGGEKITSRFLINSAGLLSGEIAAMLGSKYRIYPCAGEYAYVVGASKNRIRSMIYPVVDRRSPGLGVHLTRTIDGQLQVGPTAVYVAGSDLTDFQKTPISAFHNAVTRFLPETGLDEIREGWYGLRAKLTPPGAPEGFSDFIIEWDRQGLPVIHLVGIESPGLTASLAIGHFVASMVAERIGVAAPDPYA